MTNKLEERIGAALRAAAGNIDPTPRPMPRATDAVPTGHRRRWVAPLAAAIAVIAVVAGVIALTAGRVSQREIDRAATVTESGAIADVGGVRFPIPDGWSVGVVGADARSVRVCIAADPTAGCNGVSLTIALPGGPALDVRPLGDCADDTPDYLIHADDGEALGGRGGVHYYQWCGKSGPVSHQWVLLDFGLQIITPAGKYEQQGRQIADGLDLSRWPRSPGEQQVHWTMGTRADGSTAADVVTTNGRISVYGASFPIPEGWSSLDISDSDTVRTICLALTPTITCGGLTVRLAAPGAPPLTAIMPVDDCPSSPKVPVLDETFSTMGGRPAQHIIGTCGAKSGPAEHLWELTDRSLQISTPRGEYAEQGAAVAAGVDLDHWQRTPGTLTAGVSAGSAAVTSGTR
ncbi:hypothetical protein [Nakamurella lactea]|uniref:hypothetical protein n=1 Tax=Nakamurella lactea TaxID=459515 RepID=UPI000428C968|nr:hypothetical protein [Nakamurella lactea]